MKDYRIKDLQVSMSCLQVRMIYHKIKLINSAPKTCHACSFSILTVQNRHKYYNSRTIIIKRKTTQLFYYIKDPTGNPVGRALPSIQIILNSINLSFHMKQHILEIWLTQGPHISLSSSKNYFSPAKHLINNLILNNTKMVAIWHSCNMG